MLVLDDVSDLTHDTWSELLGLLETAASSDGKSSIIVTTRKMSVACVVRNTVPTYNLKGLSQTHSRRLFLKWASTEGDADGDRDGNENRDPDQLAEEPDRSHIIKKCKGNPLALKVLGSVYPKLNEQEWKVIKENEMWKLDHWIENYVLNQQGDSTGNMSSFQDIDKFGFLYSFYMHDLVNDLARSVPRSERSVIDYSTSVVSERVRHLSFTKTSIIDADRVTCLENVKRVRSILFPLPGIGPSKTSFLEKTFLNSPTCEPWI